MKIINFIDEVYNVKFIIFIGNEDEKNKYLEQKFKIKKNNFVLIDALTFFIEDEKEGGINFLCFKTLQLNLKNKNLLFKNLYTLQHEIQHAVFNTFDFVNIKFDAENHEHFNYYYGYIFKKIYKLLTKD